LSFKTSFKNNINIKSFDHINIIKNKKFYIRARYIVQHVLKNIFSSTNNKKYGNIHLNNIGYVFVKNKKSFIKQDFIVNKIDDVIII
jgi:hypothetical protein